VEVKVERVDQLAVLPRFGHQGDACADVASIENILIPPMGRVAVRTGLKLDIPDGYEIQVRSRSGNSINRGLVVGNAPGTIDSGYTGELKVILFNFNTDIHQHVSVGDKIAQIKLAEVIQVDYVGTLEVSKDTSRGEDGFGSTDT